VRRLISIAALVLLGCGPHVRDDRPPDRMDFVDDEALDIPDEPPPQQRPVDLGAPQCLRPKAERSKSLGRAAGGTLDNGCEMPWKGPGWARTGKGGFGTDEAVRAVQMAAADVAQRFPGTAGVVIGDFSREGGGPLTPHRSHQSGRDVDVGLFRAGNEALTRFEILPSSRIDVEKTWAFIEALLRTGRVTRIFMDTEVQAIFGQYLTEIEVPEANRRKLLQWPEGPEARQGLIRHSPGHVNHFHVRFRCPVDDRPECVD